MSILRPIVVDCPNCEETYEIEVLDSINADRRGDLRAAILDDSLQVVTCPHCGTETRVDPIFNYLDSGRGAWIAALPIGQMGDWAAQEGQAREIFDLAYGSKASPSAREVGDGLKVRLVFGWPALREKLMLADAGIDDVAVELAKLAILQGHTGDHLARGDELRVTANDDETLVMTWLQPGDGVETDALKVPRALLDEVTADAGWADLRKELTAGPFVDMQKFFVGEAAAG